MSKIVHITKEHIRKGRRGCRFGCPIARALHDAGWPGATVFSSTFSLHCLDEMESIHRYDLSPRARDFVRAFDNGEPVKPFSVRITADG